MQQTAYWGGILEARKIWAVALGWRRGGRDELGRGCDGAADKQHNTNHRRPEVGELELGWKQVAHLALERLVSDIRLKVVRDGAVTAIQEPVPSGRQRLRSTGRQIECCKKKKNGAGRTCRAGGCCTFAWPPRPLRADWQCLGVARSPRLHREGRKSTFLTAVFWKREWVVGRTTVTIGCVHGQEGVKSVLRGGARWIVARAVRSWLICAGQAWLQVTNRGRSCCSDCVAAVVAMSRCRRHCRRGGLWRGEVAEQTAAQSSPARRSGPVAAAENGPQIGVGLVLFQSGCR